MAERVGPNPGREPEDRRDPPAAREGESPPVPRRGERGRRDAQPVREAPREEVAWVAEPSPPPPQPQPVAAVVHEHSESLKPAKSSLEGLVSVSTLMVHVLLTVLVVWMFMMLLSFQQDKKAPNEASKPNERGANAPGNDERVTKHLDAMNTLNAQTLKMVETTHNETMELLKLLTGKEKLDDKVTAIAAKTAEPFNKTLEEKLRLPLGNMQARILALEGTIGSLTDLMKKQRDPQDVAIVVSTGSTLKGQKLLPTLDPLHTEAQTWARVYTGYRLGVYVCQEGTLKRLAPLSYDEPDAPKEKKPLWNAGVDPSGIEKGLAGLKLNEQIFKPAATPEKGLRRVVLILSDACPPPTPAEMPGWDGLAVDVVMLPAEEDKGDKGANRTGWMAFCEKHNGFFCSALKQEKDKKPEPDLELLKRSLKRMIQPL